jgi:hypothetical protein
VSPRAARRLERAALLVMAAGVALMLQAAWPGGMRAGFFVVLAGTVAQIVFAKLAQERA